MRSDTAPSPWSTYRRGRTRPGTAAHRAARERAGARAVAEPSFRVANEEPRRGSVRLRCRQWKRARVFSGQSSGRGTRRARPTGLERNPPRADRPSASQHGESPRHVCPRTLERAAQTRWLSPLRTSASLPRSRRCNARPERAAPPPSFAAGAPRPRARRRILPPSSPRDAPWRVAPPRTSRESRFLSRSARPRRPHLGGTFSARLCLEPAARGTRAAPSRPRGPSLSVAIVIRGALSELVRSERHRLKSRRASRVSRTHSPTITENENPQTHDRSPRLCSAWARRGAGHRRRGAPGVRPQRFGRDREAAREHARLPAHHPSCRR